jgi:hypothetical protein
MKIERTRAQKGVPVHTRYPETYIFLGVRMKILLSSKDTGDQFSLIERLIMGMLPLISLDLVS